MTLHFEVLFAHRDFFFEGLAVTAFVATLAMLLSFFIGLLAALSRLSKNRVLSTVTVTYIEVFRNTPFLVQLFFFYYGLPQLGIFIDPVTTGIVALGISAGAVNAEVIRSGLEAVDVGLVEASKALGLSRLQTYRFVIVPVALQVAFQPLSSNFINLVLTTSVLLSITVNELMGNATTVAATTFRPFEVYLAILLLYAALTFALSGILHLVDAVLISKKFQVRTRNPTLLDGSLPSAKG